MFGLGQTPGLLKTREVEDCLNQLLSDVHEGSEGWIITPYATMKQLSTQRRAIAEAVKRGGNISFVVRDQPDQVNPAKEDLSEAIAQGLKLYCFNRLHAKVYWFSDTACVLTSANLVDGSFESSTEIGLVIPEGKLHNQIRQWIKEEIEPGIKEIMNTNYIKKIEKSIHKENISGHCIRCNEEVKFDSNRPYCIEHYKSWEKF